MSLTTYPLPSHFDSSSNINMVIQHYINYIYIYVFFLERQISQGQKLSALALQPLHRMMVCSALYVQVSFTSLFGWKTSLAFSFKCFCLVGELHVAWFCQSIQKGIHYTVKKVQRVCVCLTIYLTEQYSLSNN